MFDKQYYTSSYWIRFSTSYRQEYNCCEACGSTTKLEVHHKSYKNIGKERKSDVCTLCQECHAELHKCHKLSKKNLKRFTAEFIQNRRDASGWYEHRTRKEELQLAIAAKNNPKLLNKLRKQFRNVRIKRRI